MADVSLEPADGDPFAGQIPAEFPNQFPQQQEALAADPQRQAAVSTANESVWEHLKRKFPETSWGRLYTDLTTAVPKLQSGEWDVSSPEAAERTGALGGALDIAGLGMGGGVARPGEAVLGAGPIYRRRPSAYTVEEAPLPPPPMGHNMPPPEEALPAPVAPRQAAPSPAPPIEAPPEPAIGAQPPVTAHQAPIETPPPPMPEPKPAMAEPPAPIPAPVAASATAAGEPVLNPRRIMREPEPFAAPLGTDPHEEALTVNDILHPEWPWSLPPRSAQVEWIADHLNDRAQDALKNLGVPGGRIDGPNKTTDELISRSMASEAKNALERPGANAKDWYSSTFDRAMGHAALMYPEIATNEDAAAMFRAALAVTSQGETVPSNSVLGTRAYDYFRQNGQFPTDTNALNAKEAPAMLGNFEKMNDIINAAGGGPAGFKALREFLDMDTTPAALRAAGHPASGDELANTPVKGSYILGPKIGNGFYQNLGGNYDPVTMDLWFMRQWNRRTGNLVGNPDTSGQYDKFTAALGDPSQMNDWGEQALYAGKKVPSTGPALDLRAAAIAAQHERDFKTYRADFDAARKIKSKLTRTAVRWLEARAGINEQPAGAAQRAWIRAVTLRARDILADYGHDVTPADLQAILWYPEKELYGKLGGRPSDEINVGYDTALANEARKRGFTDAQLQQAPPLSAYRRSGRAEPAYPPREAAGGGAPIAGAAPQGQGGGQVSLEPHGGDPFPHLPPDVEPGTI